MKLWPSARRTRNSRLRWTGSAQRMPSCRTKSDCSGNKSAKRQNEPYKARTMKQIHSSSRKPIATVILSAATLSVISCCPKLYPHTTENTEHIVTVTETVRDTVIQVKPDSSIVEALIRCDSTGRARLEEIRTLKQSARVQQTLAFKDNRLTTKAVVDSMGIYLTYKDRYKEELKVQTIETVIEKPVNILHWWQKALMLMGTIFIFLIVASIVIKIH